MTIEFHTEIMEDDISITRIIKTKRAYLVTSPASLVSMVEARPSDPDRTAICTGQDTPTRRVREGLGLASRRYRTREEHEDGMKWELDRCGG
jgi:hypothetical protein